MSSLTRRTGSPTMPLDASKAITKLDEFLAGLEAAQAMRKLLGFRGSPPPGSDLLRLEARLHESLALILRIAREYSDDVRERIEYGVSGGHGYPSAIAASQELLGWLRGTDEAAAIFSAVGPKLAMLEMHPWVHDAAAHLWDGGHHEAAVVTASVPSSTPTCSASWGCPKTSHPSDWWPPRSKDEKLNIPAYPDPGEDRRNAYQGAQNLGLACAKLVRNLSTHGGTTERDGTVLLEELAMLSRFRISTAHMHYPRASKLASFRVMNA